MYTEDISIGPQGAVHVFQQFNQIWIRTAVLLASDARRNDLFGSAVSISGHHIFVGSPRHDEPGIRDLGKVYQFSIQNSIWTEARSFIPNEQDRHPHLHFGATIASHQNQLIISGHLFHHAFPNSGIAYAVDTELGTGIQNESSILAPFVIQPNPVHQLNFLI